MSNDNLIEAVTRASTSEEKRTVSQNKTKSKGYEVAVCEYSTVSKLLFSTENLIKRVPIMQSGINEFKSVNSNGNYYQYDSCKLNNDKCNTVIRAQRKHLQKIKPGRYKKQELINGSGCPAIKKYDRPKMFKL